MKLSPIVRLVLLLSFVVASSGCLTRRTVTVGGQTVEDGYVIKRPIKEAIQDGKKKR